METIKDRSSVLIYKAYKKIILPDVATKLCVVFVTLIDSLIAARHIGDFAVSAIALAAPLQLFGNCLHDLLVSGTTSTLIRYKSSGRAKQADRAFGAIMANAFFWYIIAYALAIVFSKSIFSIFTDDSRLISDGMKYFIPLAAFEPFCEVGLCFERGFKTDGKSGFFGVRSVITNCANIVFSLIAVLVFNGGILGISIASGLSGVLGYLWSFSYFFHKDCTIRPDFSVLADQEETKKYLREEMEIGRVYALDDGLYAGTSAMFSKAVVATGGTAALTAVGICSAVTSMVDSAGGAIQSAAYSLINMFHADRDSKGVHRTLNAAIMLLSLFSLFGWFALNLFPDQIGALYKINSAEAARALKLCLRFDTVVVISDCFTNLFSSYMLATGKTKSAAKFAAAFNGMIAVCALLGLTGISFRALLLAHMAGSILIACLEAFNIFFAKSKMPENSDPEIQTYSYTLNGSTCSEISRKITEILKNIAFLSNIASRAALLAEECNRMILYVNGGNENDISVDFRVSADKDECVLTLIDTGVLFDPVYRLNEENLPEEFAISLQILKGFSPQATYARVVNLNVSRLIIPLTPSAGTPSQ